MARALTIPARANGRPVLAPAMPVPGPWRGLGPCLFFLFIEVARPMAWVPVLGAVRPGLLAAAWGLGAVLLYNRRPLSRPIWLMLALGALMTLHVFTAPNNYWAFEGWRNYTTLLLGCVIPLAVLPNSLRSVRILLTSYVLLHVPTAIHGILHRGKGLGSWMEDENDLAFALNAAIGLGIYLFLETRSLTKKLLLGASMALMISAIVATNSRGGFVGLGALFLYLMLTGKRRFKILLLLVLAVGAILLLAPAEFWTEMATIRTSSELGDTGNTRLYFWSIAWKIFLDHPILGVGTENYGIVAPDYRDFVNYPGHHMWRRSSHSLFFTLLPEQGLVGTILFGAILFWCVRVQRRIGRAARQEPDDVEARGAALMSSGIAAALIAVMVTGLFLSVLYYPAFWMLVGLLASLAALRFPAAERPEPVVPSARPGLRRPPAVHPGVGTVRSSTS